MAYKSKQMPLCRKVAVLCILLCIVLVLASCSSPSHEQETAETTVSLSSLNAVLPEEMSPTLIAPTGMGELVILSDNSDDAYLFEAEDKTDVVNIAAIERNRLLEKKYLLIIKNENTSDLQTRVLNDMLSGSCTYDAILTSATSTAALVPHGALVDLRTVEGFSRAKGFDETASWELSFGDKQYVATGKALPSTLYSASALIMNSDNAQGLDTAEIVSSALNGSLTWEQVKVLSAQASILNENAQTLHLPTDTALPIFLSGGEAGFSRDMVTDMLCISIGAENAEVIFNSEKALFESKFTKTEKTASFEETVKNSLFTVATVKDYKALLGSSLNVSLLPLPKMTAEQGYYSCSADMGSLMCVAIPSVSRNAANTLSMLNFVFSMSNEVYEAAKKELALLGATGTRDEASSLIDSISNSIRYGIVSMFGWVNFEEFLETSIKTHIESSVFVMRGTERATAAIKAAEILMSKLSQMPSVSIPTKKS